jgi:succinyl-CoA synthetase beta subunit
MKIHEYQAKEILRGYGVAVPRGKLVQSQEEAVAAARELMLERGGSADARAEAAGRSIGDKGIAVVKAQIHAGGRGKGGGVKLARSPEEAGEIFKKMMGMQLVTHQTGPQGQRVRKVYVEEGCDIARELYLGVTLDRAIGRNVMMASSEGGVEIEEVAATHPEKILRAPIDPVIGLAGYQARDLAFGLGLSGNAVNSFVRFATGTYKAYEATDASIVEINPLVMTKQGEVIALDAKINLDDNALYRHKDLAVCTRPCGPATTRLASTCMATTRAPRRSAWPPRRGWAI